MRWKSHVRFGGRAEETDRSKDRHRASVRSNRTNATVLVQRNVDMKTAQIRLGHADPALTLRIYAQPTDHGDRAAAALIDEHFATVLATGADARELDP